MREVICDLPIDDRPRERLKIHGPESLSNAELIAILLGSGVPGKNAIQLARELIGNDFRGLGKQDVSHMTTMSGVGDAKAARIIAAFEVARRFNNPDRTPEPPVIDLLPFGKELITRFRNQRQERLGAAFLDSRHRLIREKEIFVGTVDHAVVSTREVITYVLEAEAVNVIVYHNHPSGHAQPSAEDIAFTRKLSDAMSAIQVNLIDHLVLGRESFYSMKMKELY